MKKDPKILHIHVARHGHPPILGPPHPCVQQSINQAIALREERKRKAGPGRTRVLVVKPPTETPPPQASEEK